MVLGFFCSFVWFFARGWGLREDKSLCGESKCLHYVYSTGGTKSLYAGM